MRTRRLLLTTHVRAARRAYTWTAKRHPSNTYTFYSPSPQSITVAIQNISPTSTSFYVLSTSLDGLPELLETLQARLPNSIGSFSTTPPGEDPSLALAIFDEPGVRIWRSELSGRPPAEVGRWQRGHQGERLEEDRKGESEGEAERAMDGSKGWEGFWKGERGVGRVDDLVGVDVGSVLMLTDGTPRPVLSALDAMFPSASKLGLVTAPTPFLTGRPHTLLHNRQAYSSGTLGLAFPKPRRISVTYGLEPLTNPFIVTSAQGNMLLKIEGGNSNPTQHLIAAIQRRTGKTLGKEEEFFLAFLETPEETARSAKTSTVRQDPDCPPAPNTSKVVKILSGDPSRGALSLEMEEPLSPGQLVQYMYRPAEVQHPPRAKDGGITFSALARSDLVEPAATSSQSSMVPGFIACSEDGFIHSSITTSICSVPGATATWNIQP